MRMGQSNALSSHQFVESGQKRRPQKTEHTYTCHVPDTQKIVNGVFVVVALPFFIDKFFSRLMNDRLTDIIVCMFFFFFYIFDDDKVVHGRHPAHHPSYSLHVRIRRIIIITRRLMGLAMLYGSSSSKAWQRGPNTRHCIAVVGIYDERWRWQCVCVLCVSFRT